MSDFANVIAIVEGRTEQNFIEAVLAPYLGDKGIFIRATQVSKPGQKGGDVKFRRVLKDIERHLKQQSNTYVTTMVDYYGIKEWPGLQDARKNSDPQRISQILTSKAKNEVLGHFPKQQPERRFIPYIAIHEFEALLFSDSEILAEELDVSLSETKAICNDFQNPEFINNSRETAPSKRLIALNNRYSKTTFSLNIALRIGVETMRNQCPLFDEWLSNLESRVKL